MTIKKYLATYGAAFLFLISTSFYYMLKTVNTSLDSELILQNTYNLKRTRKPWGDDTQAKSRGQEHSSYHTSGEKSDIRCSRWNVTETRTDVQMSKVYKELPFDNPDGGVWRQGWEVTYPRNKWNSTDLLKVFVVPHSHTDPGWLMTYTQYYQNYVKKILDNMVQKLEQFPEGRFIYAEMSFFHLWWNDLSSNDRNRVRRLLTEGRFEIVTGGWVMNDEANTHYFAMVDQLIEGHQWLNATLRVKPGTGWAIDPFGHTPTMANLLQLSGISGTVLQRVHYAVKKYLAKTKQLEFLWRQIWDPDGKTDMLSHLMPYYFYDIPHTCGPDPAVCCEFDFARTPVGRIQCPWKTSRVRPITDSNVDERSRALVDQWKKKAILYRNNVLLVPLGDDFRYTTAAEWDNQFNNYLKLFRYIETHKELGVQAQFGTLSDYFRTLKMELRRKKSQLESTGNGLPTLSGDFFTYADKDDHYWSGYFTSRPFQKHLNRKLESHLRGAEILFTIARTAARRERTKRFPVSDLMEKLIKARRNLGLFQHHDGITGTAKDPVVLDYTQRLVESIEALKVVMRECATYLTLDDKLSYNFSLPLYDLDETREKPDFQPKPTVLNVGGEYSSPRSVMFYNSLGYERKSVVSILVNSPYVLIRDKTGQRVQSQTEPYWTERDNIAAATYQVSFEVSVSGLGIVIYTVQRVSINDEERSTIASVSTTDLTAVKKRNIFSILWLRDKVVAFENAFLKTVFDGETGLLESVFTKTDKSLHKTKVDFVTYGTKVHHGDKSGAYLFLPDGPAKLLVNKQKPSIYIIRGPVRSKVHVNYDILTHIVTLTNSTGIEGRSVDIQTTVDIRSQHNFELAVRISTGISNTDKTFFTDLNGFQVHKRRTYDKLSLQGNVYPMTTMAFIQDNEYRHTILSANSLGFSNLEQGVMEVMLDRRLNQDDSRGLLQGVTDNKITPSRFRLLIEKRSKTSDDDDKIIALPSVTAHQTSLDLIHAVFALPSRSGYEGMLPTQSTVSPLITNLPCDTHLLNLRTMQSKDDDETYRLKPRKTTAMILHRVGVDCTFPYQNCGHIGEEVQLSKIFQGSYMTVESARETTLTMMYEKEEINVNENISLLPMDMKTIIVHLK